MAKKLSCSSGATVEKKKNLTPHCLTDIRSEITLLTYKAQDIKWVRCLFSSKGK